MRGAYHITELVGSMLILSIHPKYQDPEFIKANEPQGMKTGEFISYGVTQRTLSQFSEVGWKLLEGFGL